MKTSIVVIILFFTETKVFGSVLEDVLVDGIHEAGIYKQYFPDNIKIITNKFERAAKENNVWLQEYTKNNPKPPLPYHSNFGMTRAEYKLFLEYSKNIEYIKEKPIKIRIKHLSSQIGITSHRTWKFFDYVGLRLSKDIKELSTSFTSISKIKKIDPSKKIKGIGAWGGYCWDEKLLNGKTLESIYKLGTVNQSAHIQNAKICIGKIQDKKEGIIFYKVSDNKTENTLRNAEFIIKWSVK